MDENTNKAMMSSGNFLVKIQRQLLSKLTKLLLLLSVSVFSLFFSHNYLSRAFPLQLLSRTIDKNFMFLLCNGLLVFVAKFSGLITFTSNSSSSSSGKNNNNTLSGDDDQSLMFIRNYEDVHNDQVQVPKSIQVAVLEKEIIDIGGEPAEDVAAAAMEDAEEKEGETEKIIVEDKGAVREEEEEEDDDDNGVLTEQEEEEGVDEEGNGKLSTEELNKKFDEFIRKMKEELRIEAQRQLIMV